ncbi:hypothetical protein [Shewanella sp. WE21]
MTLTTTLMLSSCNYMFI